MRLLASLLALALACPAVAIDDVQPKKPAKEGAKKEKKDAKKDGRDYEESKYVSLSPEAGKSHFRFNSDGDPVLSEKAQKRLEEEAKKKKADAKKAEKAAAKAAAEDAAKDFAEKKPKKAKKKVAKKALQKKKSFGEAEAAEDGAGGVDPALAAQAAQALGAGKLPPMGAPGGYGAGGDSGGGDSGGGDE